MAINKVVYDGDTLIDLTGDTVTADKLLSGYTAHNAAGTQINGSIQSKTASDMTVSGATVTAPAGYYSQATSKAVATGTAGTPTATKGTVANNKVTVTPSVQNTTGYITGGTKTGTAVTVQASELVSGTSNITSNGTFDITNYKSVSVNVSGGSDEINKFILRTISGNYVDSSLSTVGSGAFWNCTRLSLVSFAACTSVGSYAFSSCHQLTTASFPACTTIGGSAFGWGSNLTVISFPVCKTIGGTAFYNCFKLTTASFPACTTINAYAFYSCFSLTTVSFPVCTEISNYGFAWCRSLKTVSFPACTITGGYAFYYCSSLSTASFPKLSQMSGSYAFRNCVRLVSLYLKGASLCALSNSNTFSSTPIGGYSTTAGKYGSIYVPASLLASYKAATNWTYFSSRFVGQ